MKFNRRYQNVAWITLQVLFALFHTSCGPIYYAPNSAQVPLFTEEKEISGGVNAADGGIEIKDAFSLTDQIYICSGGTFANPENDSSGNGGNGTLIELGAGYYKPLSKNFSWGASINFGFGRIENHYPKVIVNNQSGKIEADIFRYALQPYLGYKNKFLEAAVSVRISGVKYSKVKGQLTLNKTDQVEYLNSNAHQVFIEPALTLRLGYKFVFFQLQDIHSFNITETNFPYDSNTFTGGIYFIYPVKKQKKIMIRYLN